jgi:serpin B
MPGRESDSNGSNGGDIMKRTGLFLVGAVLLLATVAAGPSIQAAKPLDLTAVVRGNNALAVDLYHRLRRLSAFSRGNIIFSPYSILSALAMTYAGASGKTRAEMAKALRIALTDARFHAAFGELRRRLMVAGQKNLRLLVANALWPQKDFTLSPGFLRLIATHYGRLVFPQDFKRHAEQARLKINAWVARVTMDKIKDLIPAGAVGSLTRLVLTNAIYFKGAWLIKFDPKQTREADFTLANGRKVKVKMMRLTAAQGEPIAHLRYGDWGGFKVLELPYAGKRLSMIIVLPRAHDGLARLEEKLNPTDLTRWIGRLQEKRVVLVALPRFKITTPSVDISGVLKALGMRDAFAGGDFSRMDLSRQIYISAVFHKAFIEVNEAGTEAAAATAVGIYIQVKPRQAPPVFKADRPFLYLIRDNQTGAVLFLGRVMDPNRGR